MEIKSAFRRGLAIGAICTSICFAILWAGYINPTVAGIQRGYVELLNASQQDAAKCQAKFARVTLVYDMSTSGAPAAPANFTQIADFFGGAVSVDLNSMRTGSAANQVPRPEHASWIIPADVEPAFYGDPNLALVMHYDPATKKLVDAPHAPQHVENPAAQQ